MSLNYLSVYRSLAAVEWSWQCGNKFEGKKKNAFSSTDCAVERALFTTCSASSHKIRIYSKGNIMTTITPGGPFLLKKWTFLSALKSKCLHYANLLFRMIAHLLICKIHKHSRAQDNLVRYLSTSGFST